MDSEHTCPDCGHLKHWETCSESCRCTTSPAAPEGTPLPLSSRIISDALPQPWGGD